jgi:hypothetical protein
MDRRKPGSKRRRQAGVLLAKAHQHSANQRRALPHKEARKLVEPYAVSCHEAPQAKTLARRPAPKPDGNGGSQHPGTRAKAGLNPSLRDAGWPGFRTRLACKAAPRREARGSGPPAYTPPGVFHRASRWHTRWAPQRPVALCPVALCPYARVPEVRLHPRP